MPLDELGIESTAAASDIAPSDSQLLSGAVRVVSRLLTKDKYQTGVKIRFADQRKAAKSLYFRIFNAKKADEEQLYPELLRVVRQAVKQANRGLREGTESAHESASLQK